jgi:biotin carboxyl carrier protein
VKRVVEKIKLVGCSRNLTAVATLVILAFILGVVVSFLLRPSPNPHNLGASQDPATIPINHQKSLDARMTTLQITGGGERHIQSKVSGVVTALNVQSGQVVKSGDTALEINGQKITFSYSASPPFENVDHSIWIQTPEVTVTSINVALGDDVTQGSTLFNIPNSIKEAKISNIPTNLIDGERILVIDDKQITVNSTGIVDPGENNSNYTAILASNTYSSAISPTNSSSSQSKTGGSIELNARFQLKTPVDVVVVNPSSIITNDDMKSCVTSSGKVYKIDIVGSEIGRSFIKFNDEKVPENIDYKPKMETKCQ